MLTLLTYGPAFGTPAASPFCIKAMWLLNMSGLPWQPENVTDPRSMPKQKLPVLREGALLTPDSDNIRALLESKGADFDAGLSDMQKANARAFIRMAEEHLYFHAVLDRWDNDETWPAIRDAYFASIPRLIRGVITNKLRKSAQQGLRFQGLGRFTPQERILRVEPDLQAITTRLWQSPFLFGERPSAADASVAAMLMTIRATPGKTLLKRRIAEDEVLCRYIDRTATALGTPWISDASGKLCA